jgi:hypothetical protein
MGRGSAARMVLPTVLPVDADRGDVWEAGRELARAWRKDAALRWLAIQRADGSVEIVTRLRPSSPVQAAARYLWLLSIELDESLIRALGAEPDDDPIQAIRAREGLSEKIGAWRRRGFGDASAEGAVLRSAVAQLDHLLDHE